MPDYVVRQHRYVVWKRPVYEWDKEATEQAVNYDIMLHGYMFTQSGIPVIYSGDEIGQCNDYSYKAIST